MFPFLVPPKVYEYKNVTQEEGREVTLICLSEGEPSPTITFKKVGNDEAWGEGNHVRKKLKITLYDL